MSDCSWLVWWTWLYSTMLRKPLKVMPWRGVSWIRLCEMTLSWVTLPPQEGLIIMAPHASYSPTW